MRLGAAAASVCLIAMGIAAYAAYQSPPIAECREIIADMKNAQSASIPFPVTWGISDKVGCVFASESQRDAWLTAIENYQFSAAQLQDSSQP